MVLGCLTRPPSHALACSPMCDTGENCVLAMPRHPTVIPSSIISVEVEDIIGDERARSLSINGVQLSHATVLRSELLQELLSLDGNANVNIDIDAFEAWRGFCQSSAYSPASLAVVLQVCHPHTRLRPLTTAGAIFYTLFCIAERRVLADGRNTRKLHVWNCHVGACRCNRFTTEVQVAS